MAKRSLPLAGHDADCAAIRLALDDAVAGESDAVTLARVDAHIASCAACRFLLAQSRAYRRTMRRVGQAERAPSSLRESALAMMREPRRGPND